jgi:tRNA G18 (ribose-2'-O)-methylase SpoU
VAERVSDGANLGALARNAWSLGADGLVADAAGADLYARKTIRASAGHVFELNTLVCRDLAAAARALADALGGRLAAAVAARGREAAAIPIGSYPRPAHLVVALGNEASGLSARLLAAADDRITIPLVRGADSLNVAAASAVLLWALVGGSPPI